MFLGESMEKIATAQGWRTEKESWESNKHSRQIPSAPHAPCTDRRPAAKKKVVAGRRHYRRLARAS